MQTDNPEPVYGRRWGRAAALGLTLALSQPAMALVMAPQGSIFNPDDFMSQGDLSLVGGVLNIDTSGTPTLGGAFSGNGVIGQSASANVDIAVFAFSGIDLGAGVTINVTGDRPLALLSLGDISFGADLSISGGNGSGGTGGSGTAGGGNGGNGGTPGVGPGAGGAATGENGGGGAGYGAAGGDGGGTPGSGGSAYGDALLSDLFGGSGGGGGGTGFGIGSPGAGAGGGGAALIANGVLEILGTSDLTSSGGNGDGDASFDGGGGGGSGGAFLLAASTLDFGGAIDVSGGSGGGGFGGDGGAGGGGRVAFYADNLTNTGSVTGGTQSLGNLAPNYLAPAATPEPSTIALFLAPGLLLGYGVIRRRYDRKTAG